MTEKLQGIIGAYREGTLDRRAFLDRLITITGSMAAAHLLLESQGLAGTLVSRVESEKKNISSETVEYPGDDGTMLSGYLSSPNGEGKFPAVLVIHENRGLNDHTRDVARRFAVEGFVALAPDILARKGGTGSMESPDKAREMLATISAEDALTDLKTGLAYLNRHPKVLHGQLGSVGFCWGGARSFLLAIESDLLRAAVVFYGSAPSLDTLSEVQCPVLGIYGETDERITSPVPDVAKAMEAAGKQFSYKIYEGAGHAFFNDTGTRYDAVAAKDAWTRTVEFLRTNPGVVTPR